MATWYYMHNQRDRIGPLDDEAAQSAVQAGQILPNTFVFKIGDSEWKKASDHPELYSSTATINTSLTDLPWSVALVNENDGQWGCGIRFSGASPDEIQHISQLMRLYASTKSKYLPQLSVSSDGVTANFLFPPLPSVPQLMQSIVPLSNEDTAVLRQALIGAAEELHRHQLGLWMVDKRLLFRAGEDYRIVPTFWLPAFASRQGIVSGAAPEWRDAGSQPQADIYTIAYVCYEVVTAKEYDPISSPLPGDAVPSAHVWDQVVDQALRKAPGRRPVSLTTWLPPTVQPAISEADPSSYKTIDDNNLDEQDDEAAADNESAQGNAHGYKSPFRLKVKRNKKYLGVFAIVMVLALFGGFVLKFVNSSIISPGYKRGFGSTILSYAPRSYENSKWRVVWNTNGLPHNTFPLLLRITGWDRDNVAIATRSQGINLFVWKRAGEWVVNSFGERTVSGTDSNIIFEDRDKLFYASSDDGLHRITSTRRDMFSCEGWKTGNWIKHFGNYDSDCLAINCGLRQFHFQSGTLEAWDEGEQRKFILNQDNTYADKGNFDGNDSKYIYHMQSPKRGTLVGIMEHRSQAKICIFNNSRWYLSHVIDNWQTGYHAQGSIQSLWVLDEDILVVGTVRGVKIIQNGRLSQPIVNIAGYDPSLPVVAVWGRDLSHYYFMDNKGNILCFDGGLSRIIMRGPDLPKGIVLRDAWVSPEGCIYAITDDEVYFLE